MRTVLARVPGLRRPLVGALAVVVLGLAGCSGGSDPAVSASPAPAASDGAAPTSADPSASGSPTPTLATLPVDQCLTGTYRLVRFVAASNQTYGTGEGGDVTVRFDDDTSTLSGAGEEPVTLTLGGATGQLSVDGSAKGTYRVDGSKATFTPRSASGSGTVALAGSGERKLTMKQVASVIGLEGEGQVACTAQAMTIILADVRLELGRA